MFGFFRYKDDEEIELDRNKYEGATPDQPALLLKAARRQDSGVYSCAAANGVGEGRSDGVAFVSVQYPPDVRLSMEPDQPVYELDRPNVTLTCDVLDGNPGLLIGVRWCDMQCVCLFGLSLTGNDFTAKFSK